MPVSRRTGKRYAAGSQATFGGWEPRDCCVCGKRVVLSGRVALWFNFDVATGTGWSAHVPCLRKEEA